MFYDQWKGNYDKGIFAAFDIPIAKVIDLIERTYKIREIPPGVSYFEWAS